MSEKTIAQEINELLDIERDMTANKPLGQRPPREHEYAYWERKRDIFRRIAERGALTGDHGEASYADQASKIAQEEVDRLDAEEAAEIDREQARIDAEERERGWRQEQYDRAERELDRRHTE